MRTVKEVMNQAKKGKKNTKYFPGTQLKFGKNGRTYVKRPRFHEGSKLDLR